jgi:O-antigen/teichoic acid export membrane protein
MSFREQVSIGLVGRVATAIIGLIGTVLLARLTDPVVYGTFFFAYALADTLNNPFGGWQSGSRKRITETGTSSSEVYGAFLLGLGMFTVAGTALLIVLQGFLPITWTYVAALFVSLNIFQQSSMILSSQENFGSQPWIDLMKTVVGYVFQVGLVLIGYMTSGLVFGFAAALLVVSPVVFYVTGIWPDIPSRDTIRSIWTFARPKVPESIIGTVFSRFDTLLLGFLATSSVVGYYNVAHRVTAPAVFLTGILGGAVFGDISRTVSAGQDFRDRFRRSISYVSVLSVPLVAGAIVLGDEVMITAYSADYAPAAIYLIGISIYQLFYTQTNIFRSVINGVDRPYVSLKFEFAEFSVNVVASVGLFFIFGPIGVVIGSIIAQVLIYISMSVYLKHVLSINPYTIDLAIQVGGALVMALTIVLAQQAIPASSTVRVIGYVLLGAAVYVIALGLVPRYRAIARDVVDDVLSINSLTD